MTKKLSEEDKKRLEALYAEQREIADKIDGLKTQIKNYETAYRELGEQERRIRFSNLPQLQIMLQFNRRITEQEHDELFYRIRLLSASMKDTSLDGAEIMIPSDNLLY